MPVKMPDAEKIKMGTPLQPDPKSTRLTIKDMVYSLVDKWPEQSEEISKIAEAAERLTRELGAYPGTIAWDIICFRVSQLLMTRLDLPECDIDIWEKMWARTTRPRKCEDGQIFWSPYIYRSLLRFNDAFDSLLVMYRRRLEEGGIQYRELFIQDLFEYSSIKKPKLSAGELRVFRTALKKQTISPNELSIELGTTKGYVSRVINSLRRRSILWPVPTVSFSSIGLKIIIVVIEYEHNNIKLPSVIEGGHPWVYNILQAKRGNTFTVVHLIVPKWWNLYSDGRIWFESLKASKGVARVFSGERERKWCWSNTNYEHFDGIQWPEYEHFRASLLTAFKGEESFSIPPDEVDLDGFVLDDLHVSVIGTIVNDLIISVRDIRKRLGLQYNTILNVVSDLRSRLILRERIVCSSIYAPGTLILVTRSDLPSYYKLCNVFSCLPEVYTQRTTDGLSTIIARVPARFAHHIYDDVRANLDGEDILMSYHMGPHLFRWKLPVDHWDSDSRQWHVRDDEFAF